MEKIKKEYNEIAKKYNLASWEDLDKEYELGYINPILEITHALKFVRRRINDRFVWAATFFQGLLYPNPASLISMQESKFFSEDDRKTALRLMKELMQLERLSFSLDIEGEEKSDADWIKNAHKKWIEHKKDLITFAEKLKEGWKSDEKTGKGAYFG